MNRRIKDRILYVFNRYLKYPVGFSILSLLLFFLLKINLFLFISLISFFPCIFLFFLKLNERLENYKPFTFILDNCEIETEEIVTNTLKRWSIFYDKLIDKDFTVFVINKDMCPKRVSFSMIIVGSINIDEKTQELNNEIDWMILDHIFPKFSNNFKRKIKNNYVK